MMACVTFKALAPWTANTWKVIGDGVGTREEACEDNFY